MWRPFYHKQELHTLEQLVPHYPYDMLNESFLVRVAGIEILIKSVSLTRGKRVGRAGDFQGERGAGGVGGQGHQEAGG